MTLWYWIYHISFQRNIWLDSMKQFFCRWLPEPLSYFMILNDPDVFRTIHDRWLVWLWKPLCKCHSQDFIFFYVWDDNPFSMKITDFIQIIINEYWEKSFLQNGCEFFWICIPYTPQMCWTISTLNCSPHHSWKFTWIV